MPCEVIDKLDEDICWTNRKRLKALMEGRSTQALDDRMDGIISQYMTHRVEHSQCNPN